MWYYYTCNMEERKYCNDQNNIDCMIYVNIIKIWRTESTVTKYHSLNELHESMEDRKYCCQIPYLEE